MAPAIKRKPAQKAKSKLLGTGSSTLLDNKKPSEPPPSSNSSLTSYSRPKRTTSVTSLLENPPITVSAKQDAKTKGKGKEKNENLKEDERDRRKKNELVVELDDHATNVADDQLWTDRYPPQSESELAVHKRKIDEVRHWLEEAFDGGANGTLQRFRRILALTGPAGSGKTATLKVLADELEFDVVEWQNTLDDRFAGDGEDYDYESLTSKFQSFLSRASSYRALDTFSADHSASASTASTRQPSQVPKPKRNRQIILLEDLPNILHLDTAFALHNALEDFVSLDYGIPLVCIISDSGLRGEDPESGTSTRGRGRWDRQVVDVRSVIPPSIFNSIYFREIRFNPIAPTIMTKALTALIARHFDHQSHLESSRSASVKKTLKKPNKEVVQLLVESSSGDIRSAIMALQFACVLQVSGSKAKGGGNKGNANFRSVLEAVSRREQSLVLFHLLGKILYNKRKGDPASSSSTVREREKLEEEDKRIKDPPALPDHLLEHFRRASRVNVNALYADSPIDSSLFALYLHQNYTQFCDDIDQCDSIVEQMSWTDSIFPEHNQSIHLPYQFHLLALNTLHHLPSPVPRHSQKLYKPAFFESLRETREAEGAVVDVESWLDEFIIGTGVELDAKLESSNGSGRRWTRDEIVLELGRLLSILGSQPPTYQALPRNHVKFSSMTFTHPSQMQNSRMEQLEEDEDTEIPLTQASITAFPGLRVHNRTQNVSVSRGWLESDDITEF